MVTCDKMSSQLSDMQYMSKLYPISKATVKRRLGEKGREMLQRTHILRLIAV